MQSQAASAPSIRSTKSIIGVNNLHHPIQLKNRDGGIQHSIATCSASAHGIQNKEAELAHNIKNLLLDLSCQINPHFWQTGLQNLAHKLGADSVEFEINFPFFINKPAPVTGMMGLMEYECSFSANSHAPEMVTVLKIPVTTLCPCSKEISDGGAHNQRAEAILTIHTSKYIWLEELVELIEDSGSCPVYSVLKRPDEKFVTEKAFNNPMFVEDVVRKIAIKAKAHPQIERFTVSVESFESIHKHSAFALVDSTDL